MPNGKSSEFEAWIRISENNSPLCELVSKPDPTIWDDDADQPTASTSIGSGTKREVTPSVASNSPAIKEELKALQANMEELDMADALVVEPRLQQLPLRLP